MDKRILQGLKAMAVAAAMLPCAMGLTACGDDDDADAQTLQFPETQLINCVTGETHAVEFEAAADWKLSSTQSWCKFVQDGETVLSVAGAAGKQTVTLAVSDEGLTQGGNSIAQLTLYMQGQSGVLAEVTRSAAGYELKVYDAAGNAVEEIAVGYGAFAPFAVEANYAFAATSMPDWAELQGGYLVGAAGERVEGGIRMDAGNALAKYEQEGVITFQSRDGKSAHSVKLVFPGMDRDAIAISQPGGNAWNWNVSADGQTWTHESSTYNRFVECGITAYHDDYEIVCVEESDGKLTVGCDWIHFNKDTGRLTADSAAVARTCYVLAFPRESYEKMKSNLAGALIETADGKEQVAYKYQQGNLLAHVTQTVQAAGGSGDDDADVGFIALCFDENWEMIWIRCSRVTDEAQLARCEELTGCRELFLLDQASPRGHFDQIRPWPLVSDYSSLSGESAYFMDKDGTRLEDETPELSFSDSETPNYWYIMQCHNTDEPMYLVLMDADCEKVTKVLLINTNEKRR